MSSDTTKEIVMGRFNVMRCLNFSHKHFCRNVVSSELEMKDLNTMIDDHDHHVL